MLTLTLDPADASVPVVQRKLGLKPEDIDPEFGVVALDPAQHKYAVLVKEDAATQVAGRPDVEGPFANPRIEPFGPPRP